MGENMYIKNSILAVIILEELIKKIKEMVFLVLIRILLKKNLLVLQNLHLKMLMI